MFTNRCHVAVTQYNEANDLGVATRGPTRYSVEWRAVDGEAVGRQPPGLKGITTIQQGFGERGRGNSVAQVRQDTQLGGIVDWSSDPNR